MISEAANEGRQIHAQTVCARLTIEVFTAATSPCAGGDFANAPRENLLPPGCVARLVKSGQAAGNPADDLRAPLREEPELERVKGRDHYGRWAEQRGGGRRGGGGPSSSGRPNFEKACRKAQRL